MTTRSTATIRTEGLVGQEKLKQALGLLREGLPRGLTRLELAGRLGPGGVSLRTVDRVLRLLEAQGGQIDRERSGATLRFVLREGPAWDEHVSPEARLALRVANLSLAQSGTLLWQDKLEALERLATDHMSSRDRRLFDTLQRCVQIQGGVEDPVEAPDILEPILRALERGREIQVDYADAGAGMARKRRFVPYALTHDLFSGAAFLAVWDPGDQKPKHLRLSRIECVRVSPRPGVVSRPEVMARAARYQIGGWICGEEPFEVRVRVQGLHWIQSFQEAPPALPDFQADRDGDSVLVRFKANHPNGASRWILQFGEQAQALAPAWLVRDLAAQFRRAAAHYSAQGPG
jgi:predicted DNA-binding transcriptional regulator YafY